MYYLLVFRSSHYVSLALVEQLQIIVYFHHSLSQTERFTLSIKNNVLQCKINFYSWIWSENSKTHTAVEDAFWL